jgi:hypothetical protein
MRMTAENDRYKRMMEILRNSRPDLKRPEEIENEIIKRIQRGSRQTGRFLYFIDSLFGWVYIGWVRRSLVAAAVIMVSVFVYQQALILKQVNNISRQPLVIGSEPMPGSMTEFDKKLTLYKISNRLSPASKIQIPEKQMEQILESFDSLQSKYKDLMRVIEENPELKKYIEDKLNENRKYKPDI